MNYNEYIKGKTNTNTKLKGETIFYMWLKELGMQIAKLRVSTGMRQEELAQRINVSQSMIARIESGDNLTCKTLWKIGEALGIELSIFGASAKRESEKYKAHFTYNFSSKIISSSSLGSIVVSSAKGVAIAKGFEIQITTTMPSLSMAGTFYSSNSPIQHGQENTAASGK